MGIVLLLAGLWLIKWFSGWLRKRSGRMSTLLLRRLSSLVIIALRVLLILKVMQIVGIQLTFLAVLIGGIGVAAGLALSGTLQNFASGVTDSAVKISSSQLAVSAVSNRGDAKFAMEDINKALSNVPDCYTIPFLRHFEGYKYHEIAEELELPIGTVKTRIHIARQLLQKQLKAYKRL